MEKIILVLGATGMLGRPASYSLKESGFQVRIMTRDLQKGHKAFDNSFEMVAGDPMDIGRLEDALDGCYGVHISLPNEVEQQVAEIVANLALRHGVERISYISGATVAEENRWFPMINRKFLAEKAISEAGIPSTIICPTWVMEGLSLFINQGRAAVFGKQPCHYHWVAADDIARMISNSYVLDEAMNKRYIVHGPEAICIQEALRRYCVVFHPEIKDVSSMPFWLVKLLATITGNQVLKGAGEMMSYFEKVGEWRNLPEIDGGLGVPMITLDMWLQKHKAREMTNMAREFNLSENLISQVDG
jgi:uncharacterized protein YbjT (DUF2867 family)